MKPVTRAIIITLLCLLSQVHSTCYNHTPDDSMCFATSSPIVSYPSTTMFGFGKAFAEAGYNTLYQYYNSTGNMPVGCIGAMKEFVCTFYFKPCYLYVQGGGYSICNSTTIRMINECGSLPPTEVIGESYYSYVDNNNPRCAYAFQPQCATRSVVRAGSLVHPYRIDNNFGLNYNYTTECDTFSYKDTSGADAVCKEMPAFGSSCPAGVGWNTWFSNANTAGVQCLDEKFTLEHKRHGEPCSSNLECLNSNCTAGHCFENEYYCDGLYSCRPGMYCYSNNTCVPMLKENEPCTSTDPCIAPFTCVLGNCSRPAVIGESCRVMSPGDSGVMDAPFCGPPINDILDAFTTCAGNTCRRVISKTLGSPCTLTDSCDPFTAVCNATLQTPSGYCVPPEQVSCKIGSTTCYSIYQYCDCSGGAGTSGVCRVRQDHPLVGCKNEYVQLYECLRTKCNAYNSKGQFYDLSYYPFDGYSCGNTQCAIETKNAYCCTVGLNGGAPLSSLSICDTPTPTPTTTLVPTTTAPPTTTQVPTTVAPTTAPTTAAPTASVPPTTAVMPTTSMAPTTPTVAPTTVSPTTFAPIVTSVPIAVTTSGTLSATPSGNIAEIPKPVVNNSVVLYKSSNASSIVPLSFANTTELPKNAIVQQAKVTFIVTYIEKKVTVLVTLTDEFGDIAGSVRAEISTNGTINVDISALYNQILAENQKKIEIRAIRGSILKVSLSVESRQQMLQ